MGGKRSEAPDYSQLAQASEESARIMAGLGREQLDFAKQQYNDVKPFLEDVAGLQAEAQRQQMDQAQDYYSYMRDTYRPLEKSIVESATEFNTDGYREQLASQAAADAGLAFSRTRSANERASASMGVNPNSGRFAGINAASELGLAAQRAGAMTGTRRQAEQLGYARSLDAAGIGRNLAGTSLGAYGGAVNAGSAAGQNIQSAGQNYMGNMAIGSGTIASGQQMKLQGLGNVLNAQTTAYINSNDSFLGDLGGALGGAASLYTAFGSDRRLKENIREVGVDQRTGLSLYEFNYISDPSQKKYIGVMADEVELVYPDAVVTSDNGYKSVYYAMLGIEFKEVA
jgi:hypothetical protein